MNFYIIGTSHVADESVRQVKHAYEVVKPGVIALELDKGRAYALTHKVKKPKKIDILRSVGLGGFMFYIIGEFLQRKIGNLVGMSPGSEMKAALDIAKDKSKIALIDRDISITLRRFSRKFRKRELVSLFMDLVLGPFKKNEMSTMDLTKSPDEEIVVKIVAYVKKRYPSIYSVLIEERDAFMAENLLRISLNFPDEKIMAVVGAGHVPGIMKILVSRGENQRE